MPLHTMKPAVIPTTSTITAVSDDVDETMYMPAPNSMAAGDGTVELFSEPKRAFAASLEGFPLAIAAARAFQRDGMQSVVEDLVLRDWCPRMLIDITAGVKQWKYDPGEVCIAMHMMARKFKQNDVHETQHALTAISDAAIDFATALIFDKMQPEDRICAHEIAAMTLTSVMFITKDQHMSRDPRLVQLLNPAVIMHEVLEDPLVKEAMALF